MMYTSRGGLDQSIKISQAYLLGGGGGPGGSKVDEPLDATQSKLYMLAKKMGQSYVAADLWAIMETQRKDNNNSSADAAGLGGTMALLSRSVALDKVGSGGKAKDTKGGAGSSKRSLIATLLEGSDLTRDQRSAVVLQPSLAFWLPDETSLLHWSAGQKEAQRLLKGGDVALWSELVLDGNSSSKGQLSQPGAPSQNLKLLRDLCLQLAQPPQAASPGGVSGGGDLSGDLEEVAVIVVDELLSGLRAGPSYASKERVEVLEAMYDVVFMHTACTTTTACTTAAAPAEPAEPAAMPVVVRTSPADEQGGAAVASLGGSGGGQSTRPASSDGGSGHSASTEAGAASGAGTGAAAAGREGAASPGGEGVDPVLSHLQARMAKLKDVQDGLAALPPPSPSDEASGITVDVRCRLCLIQRWAACDRLALASLLYKHTHKAVTQSHVPWSLITTVIELCRKTVLGLKLADPATRTRYPAAGAALVEEEAGLLFWVIRTVDLLCDACCRSPASSIALVEMLHDYIDAVKDALHTTLFYLQFLPRLDSLVCKSLAGTDNSTAFVTPLAQARIRLAALSHVNRCIDLCRSAMRWHSREADGQQQPDTGSTAAQRTPGGDSKVRRSTRAATKEAASPVLTLHVIWVWLCCRRGCSRSCRTSTS